MKNEDIVKLFSTVSDILPKKKGTAYMITYTYLSDKQHIKGMLSFAGRSNLLEQSLIDTAKKYPDIAEIIINVAKHLEVEK
jgi:hypothetical protein